MAGFHTKTFSMHDDYMTPFSAWEAISHFIPKDKVIWEPFVGDGKSGEYLRQLGCKEVIHITEDFFASNRGEVIVTNPPFSKSKDVLKRLKQLDKPFIVIMPCSKICTSYFRNNYKDTDSAIEIIIPRKRIHFAKMVDGVVDESVKSSCNFDCFYYCYKMNLPRGIVWLDDEVPQHYAMLDSDDEVPAAPPVAPQEVGESLQTMLERILASSTTRIESLQREVARLTTKLQGQEEDMKELEEHRKEKAIPILTPNWFTKEHIEAFTDENWSDEKFQGLIDSKDVEYLADDTSEMVREAALDFSKTYESEYMLS